MVNCVKIGFGLHIFRDAAAGTVENVVSLIEKRLAADMALAREEARYKLCRKMGAFADTSPSANELLGNDLDWSDTVS